MIRLEELRHLRDDAIMTFGPWKREIDTADKIVAGDWSIMWPDRSKEYSKPLVENLYAQALEDKMVAAGSRLPTLHVEPTRGTRNDRAESQAMKRKRIMLAYWQASNLKRGLKAYARDWLHAGAAYALPWVLWKDHYGNPVAPENRFPFFLHMDPRQAYPVAHTPNGDLATIAFIRQRRIGDLRSEWGPDHPAIRAVESSRSSKLSMETALVEELYYFDQGQWAVAVTEQQVPSGMGGYSSSLQQWNPGRSPIMEWLVEPHPHLMPGCPVIEAKRIPTHDMDGYRSALIDIVAPLEVAQNFRARLLDDLDFSIYAPVVLDNIANADQYGPGAVLVGTGDGQASIQRDRAPVNFEANQTVENIMAGIRRDAFEPPQRSGTFGASIASARGVDAVQGTWNGELAWVQSDMEYMLTKATSMAACLDEKWCYGTKTIEGMDDRYNAYSETYDPRDVFKGDYRCEASYGDRTGMDEQQHQVYVATALQLGLISKRTAGERLGIAKDVLQEERDQAIEKMTSLFIDGVLPQQIQAGDLSGFYEMIQAVDNDKMTVREAVISVAKKLGMIPPADGSGVPPGPEPAPTDPAAAMMAGMSGGIPGSTDALPVPGRELRGLLPSGVQRNVLQEA